jgi:hypothetical protein
MPTSLLQLTVATAGKWSDHTQRITLTSVEPLYCTAPAEIGLEDSSLIGNAVTVEPLYCTAPAESDLEDSSLIGNAVSIQDHGKALSTVFVNLSTTTIRMLIGFE